MTNPSTEEAEAGYEQAEAAFLVAVRSGAPRDVLAAAAGSVAEAAQIFNQTAYARYHESPEAEREKLDLLTERTEVLSELWADLADPYRQSSRSPDRR